MSKYPHCEKLAEHKREVRTLTEFLEWTDSEELYLAQYAKKPKSPDDYPEEDMVDLEEEEPILALLKAFDPTKRWGEAPPTFLPRLYLEHKRMWHMTDEWGALFKAFGRHQDLINKYLGIDMAEVEKERQQMLAEQRLLNEGKHSFCGGCEDCLEKEKMVLKGIGGKDIYFCEKCLIKIAKIIEIGENQEDTTE